MAEHTPGPWHMTPDETLSRIGVYAGEEDETIICDVTDEDCGVTERNANARLIVLACNTHDDLLAAVEATHAYFLACTGAAVADGKTDDKERVTVSGDDLDELAERAGILTIAAMEKVHGKLNVQIDGTDTVNDVAKAKGTP